MHGKQWLGDTPSSSSSRGKEKTKEEPVCWFNPLICNLSFVNWFSIILGFDQVVNQFKIGLGMTKPIWFRLRGFIFVHILCGFGYSSFKQ